MQRRSARIAPLMHDRTTQAPPDERELLGRARDGDLEAFNVLVELHQRSVYNLCYRMIGNAAAADDGAQEAFIAAYRHIGTFRGGSFRGWLLRIAANACTDELRRRARRPAVSLDAVAPGAAEPLDVPDRRPGPDELALQGEREAAVQAALLRLPSDQRMAVIMCDIEGFAYDEIAAALEVSMGTVKSRIARGREKLRRLLGPNLEQMGD
jgi:RNA polymerase sigma-70 factor (ECF subfamily)